MRLTTIQPTKLVPVRTYLNLGYLTALLDYLRQQNLSLRPVALALGISESELDERDLRVSDTKVDDAFSAACQMTGDVFVALKAGQRMQPKHLGVLGHLLLSCTEPKELVDLHVRYGRLIGNAYQIRYQLGSQLCHMTWSPLPGRQPLSPHTIEFNLAGWIQLCRMVSGVKGKPMLIEFPFPQPLAIKDYQEAFQCELRFNASILKVTFDAALLSQPLRNGHAALKSLLEPELQRRVAALKTHGDQIDSLIEQVRQAIAAELVKGAPAIADIAQTLGLSARTLQRELQSRSVNYRELLEQIRRSLVTVYISDKTVSLSDIACLLGYSDQSVFQRAFKTWFQCTPRAYRRRKVAEGQQTTAQAGNPSGVKSDLQRPSMIV